MWPASRHPEHPLHTALCGTTNDRSLSASHLCGRQLVAVGGALDQQRVVAGLAHAQELPQHSHVLLRAAAPLGLQALRGWGWGTEGWGRVCAATSHEPPQCALMLHPIPHATSEQAPDYLNNAVID